MARQPYVARPCNHNARSPRPQARRVGAVVATDKKTNVGNKVPAVDHQKIAKLDRDNEVAPPSKVAPSVGKVRSPGPRGALC